MADQLETYDFEAPTTYKKYPWDKWCDGNIWRAREGKDFTCKRQSFLNSLRKVAEIREMDLKIRNEERAVVFQFIPSREKAEFVNQSANHEAEENP